MVLWMNAVSSNTTGNWFLRKRRYDNNIVSTYLFGSRGATYGDYGWKTTGALRVVKRSTGEGSDRRSGGID